MPTSRFLLSLIACAGFASMASARDEPTLEQRLDKLAEDLESARTDAHIPGMSIAIIKHDQVIWARGFGLANITSGRAADVNTIYAIGSTTKAFTATLVGMLVDEGKANWDDPVTTHLSYFDLQVRSSDENAECTLRDLLSHRHGFVRMGILVLGGQVSREGILRTAAGAEPWDDFRAGFHYTNIMYLAAGQAAGVAAESSWDELMVERIFEPLGMSSSTLTAAEAQADPRLALGYRWDRTLEQFEREEMVDLGAIAPAGCVNSNVVDMAQWVRLQLGRGEVDGQRLISQDRLLETWSPQIEMNDQMSYGLGWMLREHDGRKVVEHGGNVDGFSAQVGLMPEEDLGYVLLMNLSAASFREASGNVVFDAMLDAWAEPSSETPAVEINFEDYTGLFVANFASFRDAEFEVLVNDGRLALAIPGQGTTDLKLPNEAGMWVSDMTDRIAISFQRGENNSVVGLTVNQGDYHFEVPRKGMETRSDSSTAELEKFVGTYVRARGGKRVDILINRGRLAINDRGKLLDFHTPDASGHASLRARSDHGATFKVDAEGGAESFIFRGVSGDQLFTLLTEASDSALPTLDEVLALRQTPARVAARKAAGGMKFTGEIRMAQAGLRGSLTIYTQGSDRYANHLDFGQFGRIDAISRGDEAWSYNAFRGFNVLKGDELTQAILEHPGAVEGDWREYFDSVEIIRNDVVQDRPVHVVRLTKGGLPSRAYWVDAETGDVLRATLVVLESSIRVPITIHYYDFKEIAGIRSPMRIEVENPASGRTVMTIEKVESGLDFGPEVFTLEDPSAIEAAAN